MITDPGTTRIWRVRLRSPTSRGEWFFAGQDNAQRFVESKTRAASQDVRWHRKHRDKWLCDEGDRTWSVEAVELQDAAGILVDEDAQHPA